LRKEVEAGKPLREIAEGLGRTTDAVRVRGQSLGLKFGKGCHRWDSDADKALREAFGAGLPWNEIVKSKLSGQSRSAANVHARKLGLPKRYLPWTESDDAAIRKGGTAREIAERLPGRSLTAVQNRMRVVRTDKQTHKPWTKEEDVLLRELVGVGGKTWTEIAAEFSGRTEAAVATRARSHLRVNLHARVPSTSSPEGVDA
jgi:predicted transcriptional regulator